MKEFIAELLLRVEHYGQSIKRQIAFVDIPWLIFDDNNIRSIFMFRRKNNEFLLSSAGNVQNGFWEYLQSMDSILIKLNGKSDLFNLSFIDGEIMILRKDGTDLNMLLINETKIKATTPDELISKISKKYSTVNNHDAGPTNKEPSQKSEPVEKEVVVQESNTIAWWALFIMISIVVILGVVGYFIDHPDTNTTAYKSSTDDTVAIVNTDTMGVTQPIRPVYSVTNKIDSIWAGDSCKISGILKYKLFYGPPNYGGDTLNDSKEYHYLLYLQKPIEFVDTVLGGGIWEKVNKVDIIADSLQWDTLSTLIGKEISIHCTLVHSHTAHHRARAITWDIFNIIQ